MILMTIYTPSAANLWILAAAPSIKQEVAVLKNVTRSGGITSFRIISSKNIAEVVICQHSESALRDFWIDGQKFDHRPAANKSFQSISLTRLYDRPVKLKLSLPSSEPING